MFWCQLIIVDFFLLQCHQSGERIETRRTDAAVVAASDWKHRSHLLHVLHHLRHTRRSSMTLIMQFDYDPFFICTLARVCLVKHYTDVMERLSLSDLTLLVG